MQPSNQLPIEPSQMTRAELLEAIAEIEAKLPELKEDFQAKAAATQAARLAIEKAQKEHNQASHLSTRAGAQVSMQRERLNLLKRELQDLDYQLANPENYPVVHSKIHGMNPVKSRV